MGKVYNHNHPIFTGTRPIRHGGSKGQFANEMDRLRLHTLSLMVLLSVNRKYRRVPNLQGKLHTRPK